MRSFTGTLQDLAEVAPHVGDALCRVVIRTETPTPNLSDRVRELLPNATLLSVGEDCAATRIKPVGQNDGDDLEEAALGTLFQAFVGTAKVKNARADRVLEVFSRLVEGAEEEGAVTFPEETTLSAPLPSVESS